jgi:uncharacterized membrane protein YagU involved in acid resistance
LTEKISHVKAELEDAAIRSRKTLYENIALSVAAAVAMAVVGIIYKKISLGQTGIRGVIVFERFDGNFVHTITLLREYWHG